MVFLLFEEILTARAERLPRSNMADVSTPVVVPEYNRICLKEWLEGEGGKTNKQTKQ